MSELIRFGVSIEKKLLEKFDTHIFRKKYTSRSKAIIDLITEELTQQDWISGKEVTGTINIVFDHHKRDLSYKLTDIQHKFHGVIISSQHIHLSHSDCMEIIVVKGAPKEVKELTNQLKAIKGVKSASLNIASA